MFPYSFSHCVVKIPVKKKTQRTSVAIDKPGAPLLIKFKVLSPSIFVLFCLLFLFLEVHIFLNCGRTFTHPGSGKVGYCAETKSPTQNFSSILGEKIQGNHNEMPVNSSPILDC